MDPLISPAALAALDRRVAILDATLLDPALGRDAAAEFAAGHPPGARFLDLATLVDPASALPNTLPSAEAFAARLAALGLSDGDAVILYDDSPWRTAARAWWMLHAAGWRDVAILDGGLAAWKAEGRPLDSGTPKVAPGRVTPRPFAGMVALTALAAHLGQIADARSAARFTGAEGDPRAAVAPGHIPGSRNLPYPTLFGADGRWKRDDALRAAFAVAGIDVMAPIVATCGSGITACTIAFAVHLLGGPDVALYDGSWSDWGADPATPKATGPAAGDAA